MLRQTKLYPTPVNCQLTDDAGPALQKLQMLVNLIKSLPADEQGSATVSGWFGVRVDYARKISDEQVREEELSLLRKAVEHFAAGGKGISAEELDLVLGNLRAIRVVA